MLKISTFVVLLLAISCSPNEQKGTSAEVDSISKSDFPVTPMSIGYDSWGADIRLSYSKSLKTSASTIYEINSIYHNDTIGFELVVPDDTKALITLKSSGKKSDNFIRVLKDLYKQEVDNSKFVDSISVNYLSLENLFGKSVKQNTDTNFIAAQNKLFFQGKEGIDKAEVYLNIDNVEHWIELKEKDEEYRPLIIKYLSRK